VEHDRDPETHPTSRRIPDVEEEESNQVLHIPRN